MTFTPQEIAANPCLSCGACCTQLRVSFYWGELDSAPGGHVPDALAVPLTPSRACMRGTELGRGRCVALRGTPGESGVHCGIHPLRPSPCREFESHLPDGRAAPDCTRMRAAIGLPPVPARQFLP